MDWLLDHAERYRSQIRSGPFFQRLANVEQPDDLAWVHQLIHLSREFTQTLCVRYSLCRDERYQRIFGEHALEEADHTDQLIEWMGQFGFLDGGRPGSVPATQETINSLAFGWRSAVHEPHDLQIVALNVLSEGVALDFYTAVTPVLDRLDVLSGRYWSVHRDVDAGHLRLGLDLGGEVTPESPTGLRYQRVLSHAANLHHQMLASWVGARVEPLETLWTDSLSNRLMLQPCCPAAAVQSTSSQR
jgi:hypothetical protein